MVRRAALRTAAAPRLRLAARRCERRAPPTKAASFGDRVAAAAGSAPATAAATSGEGAEAGWAVWEGAEVASTSKGRMGASSSEISWTVEGSVVADTFPTACGEETFDKVLAQGTPAAVHTTLA